MFYIRQNIIMVFFPVDTGRKLNVHKTFRRRLGRLLNVLCTFNLRPVSTGLYVIKYLQLLISKFTKGYIVLSLNKYTTLAISFWVIFFIVSLILSKLYPFKYLFDLLFGQIVLWPHSSTMSR